MMHIKIAKNQNITDIFKIENACFSTPWSEKSIAESLANPNSLFYIAFVDGKAAGYMGLQIFSGEGYVTNIATLPEYRRQGVAKALINEAIKNDMEFITLEVRKSNNAAIHLYSRLGFEEVGTRPNFYREPIEDAILMTRYFDI
ncbi:MAG: ribosomal protein S18-alanine N-acetyltransferase [Eubacterium sp.]